MTVLVVGGAGYIGAHVVRQLGRTHQCVVVDDLSTGMRARVGGTAVVKMDIAAADASDRLQSVMEDHRVNAVIHLAARKQVGESASRPDYYYRQNVGGILNLLEAMRRARVAKLLFSSSAAVYGNARSIAQVTEDVEPAPLSPYGETKLISEWLCRNAEIAWGLRWVALRYFNVAGAGSAELGDPAVLNLIPLALQAVTKGKQPLIYGDDYPTRDGTCVRDYVHVQDLAIAHDSALSWLGRQPNKVDQPVFNVGTGKGASVREVISAIAEVTGLPVHGEVVDRRPGDPAALVADVTKISKELGWSSKYTLRDMVKSAWEAWPRYHPA
jgi:UDP-glucose 4-epimerase